MLVFRLNKFHCVCYYFCRFSNSHIHVTNLSFYADASLLPKGLSAKSRTALHYWISVTVYPDEICDCVDKPPHSLTRPVSLRWLPRFILTAKILNNGYAIITPGYNIIVRLLFELKSICTKIPRTLVQSCTRKVKRIMTFLVSRFRDDKNDSEFDLTSFCRGSPI